MFTEEYDGPRFLLWEKKLQSILILKNPEILSDK